MAGAPVVLLGQGEQYEDPDDWRELIRARRIRRGLELSVRRDGVTTLVRPEDVPELAAVLDVVDPPGPPSQIPPTPSAPARAPGTAVPLAGGERRPDPAARSVEPAEAAEGAPPPSRTLPTAAPRRGWRPALLLVAIGVGALLVLRLCSADGFGPAPAFGDRAARGMSASPGSASRATAGCARPRGWIAKAACDDPDLARLRPVLARAYAARVAGLEGAAREALVAEQARWQASRAACRAEADPAACLATRYRTRIAELGEARASAAEAPPAPAPSADARLPPAAVIERPEWVRQPNGDEVADAYPERAQRLGIDGRARLSCRVTGAGALSACDILSEDPPEYGFGGAALRLSRYFQLRPTTADGRPVEGARVEAPVAFRGG